MSVRDVRANLSDVLGMVYYTNEPVVVEKKGKPVAVVISPQTFERLGGEEGEGLWAVVERIRERNKDRDTEEIERDVAEAVEAVRQELYGREQPPKSRRRHESSG